MPAGQPSVPGGLDRRFITGSRILRNAGSDTSVFYSFAVHDSSTGNIFVAGNNRYVGLMTRGIFGELVQGTLPPATSTINRFAALNRTNGGWLLLDGNSFVYLGPADLVAAWSDITPPASTTRRGIVEYNGVLYTATASLNSPDRDIEFSADNGGTWDSNPGIFTGINFDLAGIFTNPQQNILLAIALTGTAAVSTTLVGGVATSATWSLLPGMGGAGNHAAISDDGFKFVIVMSNGQIATSDDAGASTFSFPVDNNPFPTSVSLGLNIFTVVYVTDLEGFILATNDGVGVAFIAESNMQQIFVGSHLGSPVIGSVQCVVSDGIQVLWPGNSNNARCTLREVGQLGKTP